MTKPKWRRGAEDRPGEICAAALSVFAEKGFAAARLDEIASRAGVSKGTLYLYFKGKDDLFRAVVRNSIAPNLDNVIAGARIEAPFPMLVSGLLERFVDLSEGGRVGAVAKMVIGESRNFPELARVWHDEIASKALGAVAALIESAQNRGEVRPGDPRLHAFSLVGPMLMGLLWRETLEPAGGAPLDLRALARQHAHTVLAGLLTEAPQ
jgi:AcrR family transcriptional regulator